MKKYIGTKIAVIIGIILSIAILTFLFIYPVSYARPRLEYISSKAEEGIMLASKEKYAGLAECIYDIADKFEETKEHLKLFYNNQSVDDAVKDICFAKQLIEHNVLEKDLFIECLSNIIADINYIFENDTLHWATFF